MPLNNKNQMMITNNNNKQGDNDDQQQQKVAANGILGLGFPRLTNSASIGGDMYNPFVFSLIEKQQINEPLFSIKMGSIYDEGWSGEIIFGGIDDDYKNDLHYVPLASTNNSDNDNDDNDHLQYTYWMVYGQHIRINDLNNQHNNKDADADFPLNPLKGFIIDTGTTLTYFDKELTEKIVKSITAGKRNQVIMDDASGTYLIDCHVYDTTNKVLELELELATSSASSGSSFVKLSIPIRDLIIPLNGDHPKTATTCLFGIAPWTESTSTNNKTLNKHGLQMAIIGDSILRSFYIVFDMKNYQIGFAPLKNHDHTFVTSSFSSSLNNNNDINNRMMVINDNSISMAITKYHSSFSTIFLFIYAILFVIIT